MKKIIPALITTSLLLGVSSSFAEGTKTTTEAKTTRQQGLTPEDQAKGTRSDVELTRQIREEINAREALSTYAKNIKIITLNGKVTLRGPVRTESEKQQIATIASRLAGSEAQIQNELTISK